MSITFFYSVDIRKSLQLTEQMDWKRQRQSGTYQTFGWKNRGKISHTFNDDICSLFCLIFILCLQHKEIPPRTKPLESDGAKEKR
jgi:hypothetical protein